jgi:hypothetical protein
MLGAVELVGVDGCVLRDLLDFTVIRKIILKKFKDWVAKCRNEVENQ